MTHLGDRGVQSYRRSHRHLPHFKMVGVAIYEGICLAAFIAAMGVWFLVAL